MPRGAPRVLDDVAGVAGHSPEMESLAREAGFNNAEEMILFQRQRSRDRGQQTTSGESRPSGRDESPKKERQTAPQDGGTGIGFVDYIIGALSGK